MRSKTVLLVVVSALVAGPVLAAQHKEKAAAGKATLTAAGELKWEDVPGSNGGKLAVVKGDSKKGEWAGYLKLPAGANMPLHTHTADHHVAVVSGTVSIGSEGGAPKKLGPGSWFELTGKAKHTTACEAGADCVLFGNFKGAFDMIPVEAPKK